MRTSIKTQGFPVVSLFLPVITAILLLSHSSASANSAAPTIEIGGPQAITMPSSTVTLSGSGTAAAGNTIVSHVWTKSSGGAADIVSPTSNVTLVSGLTQGNYLFLFTVTDNTGQKSSASVIIQVYAPSAPPVVKIIGAQTITNPTSWAALFGSATAATGRNIISHVWTKTSGGAATIVSPTSDTTAVTGLTPGTYTFLLSVMDNGGLKSSGATTVTVNPDGTKTVSPAGTPTITISGPQAITMPSSTVTLTGSGTPAAGHKIVSTVWTKIVGGTASMATPSSNTTFVSGLTQGDYIFLFTVTDNAGLRNNASVLIQVFAASTPPVVKVMPPSTITLPTSSVTISGSSTPGTGRTIISHVWTKTSGGAATITSPDSDTTTVTGLAKGTYTFLLSVMDDGGLKSSGTVTITVDAASAPPPPTTTPPKTTPPATGTGGGGGRPPPPPPRRRMELAGSARDFGFYSVCDERSGVGHNHPQPRLWRWHYVRWYAQQVQRFLGTLGV
jgi:hypothetical protein